MLLHTSNRVEVIAGGTNYLNGSFYAVGANGVTVRGRAFASAAGVVEKVIDVSVLVQMSVCRKGFVEILPPYSCA